MEQLRNLLGTGTSYHLMLAFGQFLAAVLVGWILRLLLKTVGRRITAKTSNGLDDKILTIAIDKSVWVAIVFGAYLSGKQLANAIDPEKKIALQLLGYADGIIFISFILVLTIILIRITDTSIKHAIELHSVRTSTIFNETLLPLINRIINIVIGLIAVIIILDHFGQNVSTLVVSLGVGSLAVALAAQETIANMIGGFVIMLDRPFRVGDRIQLPGGDIGDVYEIGIRSTKILNFDNNLIISPNAELIKGKVTNYSYPVEDISLKIDVGVAYGTDIDQARSIMIRMARNHPLVLKDPAPEVFVVDLADSSVNLKLLARTGDFRHKFATEATIREQVYKAFNQEGVEFPFPQRVVHLRSTSHAEPKNTSKRKTSRR
jgi:small-conductance mechanosensitive channel